MTYAMPRSMRMEQLALEKAPYKSIGNYHQGEEINENVIEYDVRKDRMKSLQLPSHSKEAKPSFQPVHDGKPGREPLYDD